MRAYIEKVINAGGYDLADMIDRIIKLYAASRITYTDAEALIALASEKAAHCDSLPPLAERIMALEEGFRELAERVAELAAGDEPGSAEPNDEWPEYVQPTGAHNDYRKGDKITYKGKRYTCVKNNVVWPPDVYPQGWEYVEDAPEQDDGGQAEQATE